jgi:DNA-binding NtrC family response regulator
MLFPTVNGYAYHVEARSVSYLFEVLVAYSDSEHSQVLATILGYCGLMPVLCSSLKEAQTLLRRESIRLVLCEERLSDGTFRDMLQETFSLGLPLVVFSRRDDSKLHLDTIESEGLNWIIPPFHHRQIEGIVRKTLLSPRGEPPHRVSTPRTA